MQSVRVIQVLHRLYVNSLETFVALLYGELNLLALLQCLEAISLNRGVVDEDVLPLLAGDEAEPLAVIEPLHCASFLLRHYYTPLILDPT